MYNYLYFIKPDVLLTARDLRLSLSLSLSIYLSLFLSFFLSLSHSHSYSLVYSLFKLQFPFLSFLISFLIPVPFNVVSSIISHPNLVLSYSLLNKSSTLHSFCEFLYWHHILMSYYIMYISHIQNRSNIYFRLFSFHHCLSESLGYCVYC